MGKFLEFEEVVRLVGLAKQKQQKIVTTNGCFDLLHIGHLTYLTDAKNLGDLLIVGINSDKSVKKLKGDSRPLNNEVNRAKLLAAFSVVDYTFIFTEDDPCKFLSILKPEYHAKGGDYSGRILEQDIVEDHGGKVCLLQEVDGVSTTKIIEKMSVDN